MNPNNTLLWLEDNEEAVEDQITLARKYFNVERVSQLHRFRSIIDDDSYTVKAIILDILLYRVYDLSDLGIKGIDTDEGYEAGWRVLEHYLRSPESKFKHIPILILSMRAKREEDQKLLNNLNQNAAPINFIEKRGYRNWYKDFKEWVIRAARGVQ